MIEFYAPALAVSKPVPRRSKWDIILANLLGRCSRTIRRAKGSTSQATSESNRICSEVFFLVELGFDFLFFFMI